MIEGGHIIFSLVNLFILAFFLVFAFKKPTKKFIFSRSKDLKDRHVQAKHSLERSEKEYEKNYSMLVNINEHMKDLMDTAEREGETEGLKNLFKVEGITDHVITQSMSRANNEIRKKNLEFYNDITIKSVVSAEAMIKKKITLKDDIKFSRTFLHKLIENHVGKKEGR